MQVNVMELSIEDIEDFGNEENIEILNSNLELYSQRLFINNKKKEEIKIEIGEKETEIEILNAENEVLRKICKEINTTISNAEELAKEIINEFIDFEKFPIIIYGNKDFVYFHSGVDLI